MVSVQPWVSTLASNVQPCSYCYIERLRSVFSRIKLIQLIYINNREEVAHLDTKCPGMVGHLPEKAYREDAGKRGF